MNWCKIGLHDWEVVQDTGLIWEAINDFLKSIGFTKRRKDSWDCWERGDSRIWEFLPFSGGVSRVIPASTESKVCLRCGKAHKNYDLDRIISKVHEMVLEKEAELAREKKALDLLGRSK